MSKTAGRAPQTLMAAFGWSMLAAHWRRHRMRRPHGRTATATVDVRADARLVPGPGRLRSLVRGQPGVTGGAAGAAVAADAGRRAAAHRRVPQHLEGRVAARADPPLL